MSSTGDKYFITDGKVLSVFEIEGERKCLAWMSTHENENIRNAIFSHDGRWVAVASDGRWIRLLDNKGVAGGSNIALRLPTFGGAALAFSPDNASLASGASDTRSIEMVPEQSMATADRIPTVDIWDMETREIKYNLSTGAAGQITSLQFSPDGQTLAAGHSNGSIYFWRSAPQEEITHFERVRPN